MVIREYKADKPFVLAISGTQIGVSVIFGDDAMIYWAENEEKKD